jgi:hypothetical protein
MVLTNFLADYGAEVTVFRPDGDLSSICCSMDTRRIRCKSNTTCYGNCERLNIALGGERIKSPSCMAASCKT